MWYHAFGKVWLENMMFSKREVDTGLTQMRIIETVESIKAFGVDLRRAVAAQQPPTEIDADLGHPRMSFLVLHGCKLNARDKVLLAIGAELSDGKLRAR